jgi:hypothetical protein
LAPTHICLDRSIASPNGEEKRMPELPEIHNFARTIQEQAAHRTFNRIVQPRVAEPKWPQIDSRGAFEAQAPFTLSAVARGKELQLTMVLPNGLSIDFVFNHGLVPISPKR